MDRNSTTSHYHAYLLRIWRDDESTPWRVQLENPHTGTLHGFASLEAMYAFLEKQTTSEKWYGNTTRAKP